MVCMIYTLMMKKFPVSVLFHNHSQKARKDKFFLRFIVSIHQYLPAKKQKVPIRLLIMHYFSIRKIGIHLKEK